MTVNPPRPPTVSVVVPVYNAAEHLGECLASIVRQSLGFERIEVLAVDDGSTDGSGELLDDWAARHPGRIRVLHQPNSGAPGGPRNRAIELAAGEYLFFADPDDYLGDEGLERMVAAAERHGSDVVLGRIRGVGRKAPTRPFARGAEVGDVHSTHAVWSLTAHKLFRRSLVERHKLRFAEGVRLAEEQPLVVPAYFLARSIAVVRDYDCYHLVHRPGFEHLTHQVPEPAEFYGVVREALRAVVQYTEPGPGRDALLRRWAEQEVLGRFRAGFPDWPRERREAYTEEAGRIAAEFLPDGRMTGLPPLGRLRLALIRERRTDDLVRLARFQFGRGDSGAEGTRLELPRGGRRLEVTVRTGVRLPKGVRVADLLSGAEPDTAELTFRRTLPVPDRPGRSEPRLLLRSPAGTGGTGGTGDGRTRDLGPDQDLPLRVVRGRLPAPRPRLRLLPRPGLHLVWVGRRGDGSAVLHVGGSRAVAGALLRRLHRLLRRPDRR
jgi:glycosyltransferase involved in cell wall biosynthesis